MSKLQFTKKATFYNVFMYKTRALQLFTEHCYITDKNKKKQKIYLFTLKHRSALLHASFISTVSLFISLLFSFS